MARPFASTSYRLTTVDLLTGAADPSAGAGTAGAVGSAYYRTTNGELWIKTGAGATAWTKIGEAFGPAHLSTLDTVSSGFEFIDDLVEEALSTLTNTGAGSAQTRMVLQNNRPGLVEQSVLTAGVSAARVSPQPTSAPIFFGGGEFRFVSMHNIPVLSSGVENITVRIGAHDAAGVGDVVDGVYFEYDLAANGNNNYWLCASNNSVRTKADTGVIAQANVFRTVRFTVNAAGTLVTGSIDGVAFVATVAANIPTTLARATRPTSLQAVKQLGNAVALTVLHDLYGYAQQFTTAR